MKPETTVTGRILVVDDDPTVADVVARYLLRDGHEVECVADGRLALTKAAEHPPDLVVLDLMLPGMDGLEVCRRLRQASPVPVVMLTALGEETDRLVGLETGADDYVTKPFSPRELALRVRSVLRRARGSVGPPNSAGGFGALGPHGGPLGPLNAGPLRDGDLVVDVAAHEAKLGDGELALTAREFDLLAFLMRHPRRAFTRDELLERVWGWSFGDSSTVTVHVRRLREKIEDDPTAPRRILTVWGVGYRYETLGDGTVPADAAAAADAADTSDTSDMAEAGRDAGDVDGAADESDAERDA
jgi:DNA-binding response OmpR family regulator